MNKGEVIRINGSRKNGILSLTGFTLLEVLLVVIIVVIIAALATPRFRGTLTTIQLSDTTQDIAQLMRLLRVKATAENVKYQLKFDLTAKTYLANRIEGNKSSQFGELRLLPEEVNVVISVNPVNFYSDGTIDKAAIYLFRGSDKYNRNLQSAISKDIDLGQIQDIIQTSYVYAIKTQPSLGRVEVILPSS